MNTEINSLDKESVKKPEIRQSCLIPKANGQLWKMGAAPTTQTQPIFFLFLRYLSTCPCPLAVTLVTHVVLKQLAERAGTLSYLHALQILDFPGSVCKTSGRFCTACARNISAKRKKKKKNRTDFTWYIWSQVCWTWLWSLLLQKNKASHGPNIASLAVQSVQDEWKKEHLMGQHWWWRAVMQWDKWPDECAWLWATQLPLQCLHWVSDGAGA